MNNPKMFRLAATMLTMAAAEFSNHGCNDFETPKDLDTFDLMDIARLMDEQNSGLSGLDLDDWRHCEGNEDATHEDDLRTYMVDFRLMRALALGLRKQAYLLETRTALYDNTGLATAEVDIRQGETVTTLSGVNRIGLPREQTFMDMRRAALAHDPPAEHPPGDGPQDRRPG